MKNDELKALLPVLDRYKIDPQSFVNFLNTAIEMQNETLNLVSTMMRKDEQWRLREEVANARVFTSVLLGELILKSMSPHD